MSRIAPSGEAFSRSRQRRPRIEMPAYLDFIRGLPCLVTGRYGVDAAHIRYARPWLGKRATGLQEKPDDRWAVPLCREAHESQHRSNEVQWWQDHNINPILIALALFGAYHDKDTTAAEHICRNCRLANRRG